MVNAQINSAAQADPSRQQNHINNLADEMSIRQIVSQWKDGYNKGESSKVADLYTEDAYYLTQHFITGIVHGRSLIQSYVQRGADARYRIDSIRIVSIDCFDNFAYAITRYDADNGGKKAFGVNLVVLRKIDGKWLIVAHEAAVPDPDTAIQRLDSIKTQ